MVDKELGQLLDKYTKSLQSLAVHEAASTGDYDALKELVLDGEFNINLPDIDYSNKTPLHWACEKGYVECARLLIENGAIGDARADTGWTPAHYAAEAGKLTVLRALHTANVAIDRPDNYGCTPRRLAEIYGRMDCVKYLEQAEREAAQRRVTGVQDLSNSFAAARRVSNIANRNKTQDDKKKKDGKQKRHKSGKK